MYDKVRWLKKIGDQCNDIFDAQVKTMRYHEVCDDIPHFSLNIIFHDIPIDIPMIYAKRHRVLRFDHRRWSFPIQLIQLKLPAISRGVKDGAPDAWALFETGHVCRGFAKAPWLQTGGLVVKRHIFQHFPG
jgi:hypothetical protein